MNTHRQLPTLLLSMFLTLPILASGGSQPASGKGDTPEATQTLEGIDSLLTARAGKETASIVLHADSVVAHVIPWGGQTLPDKVLPEWMARLAQYTLCQPDMYRTARKVYSRFEPYATLTFCQEGLTATLHLDYGIGKWVLLDAEGQMAAHGDMPSQQLLPMLLLLYPDSKLLTPLYDEYLQAPQK